VSTEHGEESAREPQEQGFLDRKTSRRGFLSGLVKGGLGAGAIGAGISAQKDFSGEQMLLPQDILSPEELSASNIRINNTSETELYLRKEVFDFDLFKDAKEGKLDEVVITLVDDDSLSWNALGKIDDEFVRTLAMATEEDPIEYVEKNYDDIRKDGQRDFESRQSLYAKGLEELRLLNEGELAPRLEQEIKDMEDAVLPNIKIPQAKKFIDSMLESKRERLQRIADGTEREILVKRIENDLALIQQAQELLDSTQDIDAAKEYFSNQSHTYGRIVRAKGGIDFSDRERFTQRQADMGAKLDSLDPEWHNKVFVLVSVGGRMTPKPEDSYPEPDWYELRPPSFNPDDYLVDMLNSRAAGLHVMRHEVMHYDDGKLVDEGITDRRALDSMGEAALRLKENKDTSGYSFVYKNKHGITYAKKPKSTEELGNI